MSVWTHVVADWATPKQHQKAEVSIGPDEKACSQCGVVKSLTEYYDRSGYPGKTMSACKRCTVERTAATIKRKQTERKLKLAEFKEPA